MNSKNKKPLHVATSLAGLNERLDDENLAKNRTPNSALITMKKLLLEAEKAERDGDEEKSYIFYMRFVGLISNFQKNKNCTAKDKESLILNIGNNLKVQGYVNKIEMLQNNLKKRYSELQESQIVPVDISSMPSPPEETQQNNSKTSEQQFQVVSCETLHKMIKDEVQILLLDVRRIEDFDKTRIDYKYCINVPENIIHAGYDPSNLTNKLPNESRIFWGMRDKRKVIIVDWESKNFERNSAAWNLSESIRLYDKGYDNRTSCILEGGYEEYRTKYPAKCVDPHYVRPKQTFELDLDQIQYPDDDLLSENGTKAPPRIDRSIKKNAIAAHDKNMNQIVDEVLSAYNKSIQNEKDMLSVEESIKNDENEKENEDPSKNEKRYKLFELETKQIDISVNEQDLLEQLNAKKDKNEQIEPSKIVQLEKMRAERARIAAERESKKREREEIEKKKAVEEKRSRMVSPPEPSILMKRNEVVLTPRSLTNEITNVPIFDRSTKPRFILEQFTEDDFAPIKGRADQGLCGLRNLGNTCYMNSIVQCISNTFVFSQYLLVDHYKDQINFKSPTKGRVVNVVASVIKMLWKGDNQCFSPRPLKSLAGEQDSLFLGDYQQDAHEFLILLIDWLQSDLQTIRMTPPMNVKLPASEKAWLEYTKGTESTVHRTFYGQIKSTLTCTACKQESATYETFSNLSLELPADTIGRRFDIENCFDSYFARERIEGWSCPSCKVPRVASKKLSIAKLPPVLLIHLKRFQKYDYSNSCRKNNIYIDFPLDNLNMIPFVSVGERSNSSNARYMYSLYGVSNHYGRSMESGHYTAFCKNYKKDKWFKFDDSNVSYQDPSDLVSSAAYVLFYTNVQAGF